MYLSSLSHHDFFSGWEIIGKCVFTFPNISSLSSIFKILISNLTHGIREYDLYKADCWKAVEICLKTYIVHGQFLIIVHTCSQNVYYDNKIEYAIYIH